MIKKEYTKDDLTVVWEPGLCIHSGACFRSLPSVFKPLERPWIQLDNAEKEAIIKTVEGCPSHALSIKQKAAQNIPPFQPPPTGERNPPSGSPRGGEKLPPPAPPRGREIPPPVPP